MCGIFLSTVPRGFGPNWGPTTAAMLAHRGPDAEAWSESSGIGAVHTRLAVLGLGEAGAQPMSSTMSSDLLVYNGEIVNFKEIAAARGIHTTSDARVLLDILAREDVSALTTLRGMFSFVYWNPRHRTLWAARDQYGIKPLFLLRHGDGGLSFCSEMRPLLRHQDARAINPTGIAHFLAEGHTGPTTTVLQGLSKIDPGHLYSWHVDPNGRAMPNGTWSIRSTHTAVFDLRSAIRDSVDHHLVSDVDVGVFLSGGVDSTLLAALASRVRGSMKAFTLSFPSKREIDESDVARSNARVLGLEHHVLEVDVADMYEMNSELVMRVGEPIGDPAAIPLALLARFARENVAVCLAGEGADEIFAGYRRYTVDNLVEKLPAIVPGRLVEMLAVRGDSSPRARAMEALLWGRKRAFRAHSALLTGEYATIGRALRTHGRAALMDRERRWRELNPVCSSRALAYDRDIWLPNTYLEKTDRASMLSGLEVRVPFLDPMVVSAVNCGDIRGNRKWPLRAMLSETWPQISVHNVKRGLAVDTKRLLLTGLSEPLLEMCTSGESLLFRLFGASGQKAIRDRSRRSPYLAFRVAQLGIWDRVRDQPQVNVR